MANKKKKRNRPVAPAPKKRPTASAVLPVPATSPAPSAGMTREEYLAFVSRVADEFGAVDRVSDSHLVFWVKSELGGMIKANKRPLNALLRDDGLVILTALIDRFHGEASIAKQMLLRNNDACISTRTILIGDRLQQFWACRLEFLVANEWIAAFDEMVRATDKRALELGTPSNVTELPPPSSPATPTEEN